MTAASPLRGCFVTGTDTGVGKTRVAAGILHLLAAGGSRTAGFKPIAAGAVRVGAALVNDDVRALRDASSIDLTDAEVGPNAFEAACAPHIAAALEGRSIDIEPTVERARALARRADWLVVEGVGGFCVPLDTERTTADLAVAFALPVVLVVGLRLGCLNHALLTAQAVRARGLRLAGWVANRVDPAMPWADANLHTLQNWLRDHHGTECLGVIPWLTRPDPEEISAHLDAPRLIAAIHDPDPAGSPP